MTMAILYLNLFCDTIIFVGACIALAAIVIDLTRT